jgi:hypothetical protein
MPKSKSKTKQRKEQKLRPYRVDYFLHNEMLKDKALVRSMVIRAVTAGQATDDLASILPLSAGELTIIRAYRFYKKLSAEPVRKTYIAIDKLLSAKEAIAVMTAIENRHVPIVIRPEDLGIKPQPASEERVEKVMAAVEAVDPTTLPQDHPDHVCSDACYSIQEVDPKEVVSAAKVFVPEWGPDADTSNVAAGQPSPYTFPNKPLIPASDAAFDGFGDEVVTSQGFEVCRWHGWKYIDLRDGRCTATDAGSGFYYDTKYKTELALKQAAGAFQQFGNAVANADEAAKNFAEVLPRNVNLDEAAPVIYPPAPEAPDTPSIWRPIKPPQDAVYDDSGFRRDPAQAVERPSKAPLITLATIAAIVGLVLAYFHWFKH